MNIRLDKPRAFAPRATDWADRVMDKLVKMPRVRRYSKRMLQKMAA